MVKTVSVLRNIEGIGLHRFQITHSSSQEIESKDLENFLRGHFNVTVIVH